MAKSNRVIDVRLDPNPDTLIEYMTGVAEVYRQLADDYERAAQVLADRFGVIEEEADDG